MIEIDFSYKNLEDVFDILNQVVVFQVQPKLHTIYYVDRNMNYEKLTLHNNEESNYFCTYEKGINFNLSENRSCDNFVLYDVLTLTQLLDDEMMLLHKFEMMFSVTDNSFIIKLYILINAFRCDIEKVEYLNLKTLSDNKYYFVEEDYETEFLKNCAQKIRDKIQ